MKVTNKEQVDIAGLSQTKKNKSAGAAGNLKSQIEAGASKSAAEATSVEISSEAKAAVKAKDIARTDDVDQAKISRVKSLIAEGKYKPDMGKVADRMINESVLELAQSN